MRFSASEAAFEGFRLTRQHPLAVLAWAAVMFAANVASAIVVALVAGPKWEEFDRLAKATPPDLGKLQALIPQAGTAAIIAVGIQLVAAAVVHASALRALLSPGTRPRIGFGADEVRVAGLLVAFIGVSFAATVGLGVAIGLLAVVAGAGIAALSPVAAAVISIMLCIRLALAGPMTIDSGRFRFWASWSAMRGWTGQLLGAELLACGLALVVAILAYVVLFFAAGAILVGTGGSFADVSTLFTPDMSSLAAVLRPGPLIYVAFGSMLYGLVLVILLAPPAHLYRALKDREAELEGSGI